MAEDQTFNLLYILDLIKKYFWYIAGIVLVSGFFAIIFTMPAFYPPEYMSQMVVYPTNAERFDGVGLFAEEPNVFLYGDSKGVERLKNIANSEEVMMAVMDSLDLWKEYGVDKENDESPKFNAARVYGSRVSVVKIGGNGMEITAYDTDPDKAAAMANLIAFKVNEINKRMINANKKPILEIYKNSLAESFHQVEVYADSASKVRKEFYIFDDQAQTEVLLSQVIRAESGLAAAVARQREINRTQGAGSSQGRRASMDVKMYRAKVDALVNRSSGTKVNLEKFQEGLDRVAAISDVSLRLARDIKNLQSKVENLEMMEKSNFNTLLVIEQAQASDRKARPIRWIILLATLLLASVVCIVGVVLIDLLIRMEILKKKAVAPKTSQPDKK